MTWLQGVLLVLVVAAVLVWALYDSDELIDARVLAFIDEHPDASAAQISGGTGFGSAVLYPSLQRLEHERKIMRRWASIDPDGGARRALYSTTVPSHI